MAQFLMKSRGEQREARRRSTKQVVIAAGNQRPVPSDDTSRAAATPRPPSGYSSPSSSQGPVPCEFLLYCDGSFLLPCAGRRPWPWKTGPALRWSAGHSALDPGGIRGFDEWLAVMIEETEAGYADDAMYLLPETTPAIDYELPSPEPGS